MTFVRLRAGLAAAGLLLLGACAVGKPFDPPKVVDEIPPGPGLFSGEDGEFVLYRR